MLIRLALRNLTRNFRRTVLSLISVVAGVAVIVLGQGFIGGFEENIIRAQVDTLSGHVLLRPAEYPTEGLNHPVDMLFTLSDEDRAWLDQRTQAWTERTLFAPKVVAGADSLRVRAIGFDPKRDEAVFPRDQWRVDGKIPQTREDGVLLGVGVARLLKRAPGERVVLQTRTVDGAVNALDVPVAGVVRVGSPLIDRFGMLVPDPLVDELVQSGPKVSHALLRLESTGATEGVYQELLTRKPAGTTVSTWAIETEGMLRLQRIRRAALNLLVLALMGMSASGIANTVLMAAYERVREIGTLRALGMTEGGVLQLFVLEGALMGAMGALLGGLFGGAVVKWYNLQGIDLTPLLDSASTGNLPVAAVLYTQFSPSVLLLAMAFGVAVAVLASIYPARVASRMAPADAVRA